MCRLCTNAWTLQTDECSFVSSCGLYITYYNMYCVGSDRDHMCCPRQAAAAQHCVQLVVGGGSWQWSGAGQGAGQGRVYISSSPSQQAGGGAGAGRGRAGESRVRARRGCSSSGPCSHHGSLATVAAEGNPAQHRCHQHRVSGCSVQCPLYTGCCVV